MRLTWRDGATTVLAGLVIAIAFATVGEWGWPLLSSYRAGAGVLLVVGLSMCIIGGSDMKTFRLSEGFTTVASFLGFAAMGLGVAGIVTGSKGMFVALAVITVVLWILATVHHAVGHEARARIGQSSPAA